MTLYYTYCDLRDHDRVDIVFDRTLTLASWKRLEKVEVQGQYCYLMEITIPTDNTEDFLKNT